MHSLQGLNMNTNALHSNYGLGGDDGALMVDLVNLKDFSMDEDTWYASVGAGHRLGEMDKKMHAAGKRAMAHGTCPSVGIGGHATIVRLLSIRLLTL